MMQKMIDDNDSNVADNLDPVIQVLKIEEDIANCNLTNIEEVSIDEESKFSTHNDYVYDGINFSYVDYNFSDHLISMGLIQKRYEKIEFKKFYMQQTDDYKLVFKQVLNYYLMAKKNQKKDELSVCKEEIKTRDNGDDENLVTLIDRQSKQEQLERESKKKVGTTVEFMDNNKYVKILNVDYTSQQQGEFLAKVRIILQKDTSAQNRCINGSILQEMTNLGIRYEMTIVQEGLSHQPAFEVMLVVKQMGIRLQNLQANKALAKQNVLKQFTNLFFQRKNM